MSGTCTTCGKPLGDEIQIQAGGERTVCTDCVSALEGKWGELSFDTNQVLEIVDGVDLVKERNFSELPHQDPARRRAAPVRGRAEDDASDRAAPAVAAEPRMVPGDEDDDDDSVDLVLVGAPDSAAEDEDEADLDERGMAPAAAVGGGDRADDHDSVEDSDMDSGVATLEQEVGVARKAGAGPVKKGRVDREDDDDYEDEDDDDDDDFDDDDDDEEYEDEEEDEFEDEEEEEEEEDEFEDEEEDEYEEDEEDFDDEESRKRPDSRKGSGRAATARSGSSARPGARDDESGDGTAEVPERAGRRQTKTRGPVTEARRGKRAGTPKQDTAADRTDDVEEGSKDKAARRKSTTDRTKGQVGTTARSRRGKKEEAEDAPPPVPLWKRKAFLVQLAIFVVGPVLGLLYAILVAAEVLPHPLKDTAIEVTENREKDWAGQWKALEEKIVLARAKYKEGLDAKRAIQDPENPNDPNRIRALEAMNESIDLFNQIIPEGDRILEENRKFLVEVKNMDQTVAERATEKFYTDLEVWKRERQDPQSIVEGMTKKKEPEETE